MKCVVHLWVSDGFKKWISVSTESVLSNSDLASFLSDVMHKFWILAAFLHGFLGQTNHLSKQNTRPSNVIFTVLST